MALSGADLSPTQRKKAAAMMEALIPQMSQLYGSGAPQEKEAERMMDSLVNPTHYTVVDTAEIWKNHLTNLRNITNAALKPYNYSLEGIGKETAPAGVSEGRI